MDVAEGLKRVVDTVGSARFEAAAAWAWRTAADEGVPELAAWPEEAAAFPRQIIEGLFPASEGDDLVQGAADVTRHAVAFACYRRMPCTAILAPMPAARGGLAESLYWDEIRSLLDHQDDRAAGPVIQHLSGGDFMAGGAASWRAWHETTRGIGRTRRRMRRVLWASGPVPWPIKRELLSRLRGDPNLGVLVGDAVAAARSDPHGDIDEGEARRWGF
jgi:hypothetical protein